MLAEAGPLLRACIIAGVELGIRLGEVLRIVWADVNLTTAKVWVTDLKDPTRRRQLPASTRLLAVLAMRRTAPDGTDQPDTAYVFGNEVGERVQSVYTAWVNAVLKAHGQPVLRDKKTKALLPESQAAYAAIDLIFSDLRHEATSGWLDKAVPMHTIREWLGHKTFAMLATYGHTTPQESARAMADFEAACAAATAATHTCDWAAGGWCAICAKAAHEQASAGKLLQSGDNQPPQAPKRRSKKAGNSLIH